MKKIVFAAALLLTALATYAGLQRDTPLSQMIYRRGSMTDQKNITLTFAPMEQKELPPITMDTIVDKEWSLISTQTLTNVSGLEQILVHFYQSGEQQNRLVLQDRLGFCDLELAGEPGGVSLLAKDVNMDDANELVVLLNEGAAVQKAKVIAFNGEAWISLLDTENVRSVDIGNDGEEVLVSESMGSLPGFVWIYRWNGTQFEKSDVVKDTGNIYAAIVTIDGKTAIETGKENAPKYYRYFDGTLIEIAH